MLSEAERSECSEGSSMMRLGVSGGREDGLVEQAGGGGAFW